MVVTILKKKVTKILALYRLKRKKLPSYQSYHVLFEIVTNA